MLLNSNIVRWIRYTQFPVAIAVYLFFALVPNPQAYVQINYSDLALHGLGNFLLLASAWLSALDRSRPLLWALVIALPLSFVVEASQALTNTRTPDYLDLMANLGGIFTGLVVCGGIQQLVRKSRLSNRSYNP